MKFAKKRENCIDYKRKIRHNPFYSWYEELSKSKMAVPTPLAQRASEWIDPDVTTVAIRRCSPGTHARDIKPGGVVELLASFLADGYKRVIIYLFIAANH